MQQKSYLQSFISFYRILQVCKNGVITLGNAINKNLSDYPQEIQDFMSEVDLNKLKEISDNMRPIVKGAAKIFYDTYGW